MTLTKAASLGVADWRALGTGVRLVVAGGDLAGARAAVEAVLEDVDRTFSRFRADSELVGRNAAAGHTTAVSPLLARAIAGSLDAARRSLGAVDPTVGHALRAIGYDADFDIVAAMRDRPLHLRLAPVPGWHAVALDTVRGTVHVPAGVELDLGSTGKGLAADMAAAAALAAVGPDAGVLVGLGGDIATAGNVPEGGWRIRVADDSQSDPAASDPGRDAETIAISGGAIATSSTTVRRWTAGGVTVHHIVDPRTGLHALTPWRTVTVAAASAEVANGASTAAVVLAEAAPAWLERLGAPARLVRNDGRVLRLNGWPLAGTERPAPA